MNHTIRKSIAIAGFCAATVAGDVTAQTTAVGPYYATPSWDQTLPSASRFLVLANLNGEAVLDRETGLVWWRTPSRGFISTPHARALKNCIGSNVGGRGGWRLPTAPELATLFDPSQPRPYLVAGHPFLGLPGTFEFIEFWTSTSEPATGRFYVIGFYPQGVREGLQFETYDVSASGLNTWCVRGPT